MPEILEWLKFVYERPVSLPLLILLGAVWVFWQYGRHRWNKGDRGLRKFALPVLSMGASVFVSSGLLAGYLYLYRGLPPTFDRSEIGVLVAEVPGDKENQWQSKYARAIQEQVDGNPRLRGIIKVRLLERRLPADPEDQQAEALAIARRVHAALVLRPLTIEGVQEPWLTVVDEPHFSRPEDRIGKEFPNANLARLEELRLPTDVVLLSRCVLALSFHRRGSYAQAREQLKEVLAASQLPPMAPARTDLEVFYGDTFLALEQPVQAEAEYRTALGLKPEDAETHNKLGIALANQDEEDQAIAELRRALTLNPEFTMAYVNVGVVLAREHRYDEAIVYYRKALGRL